MNYPASWNDPDHIETRGRKPKAKPAGLTKVTVELAPAAMTVIETVKATCRAVRFPVPSRSEIIAAALSGYDKRHAETVKATVADLGDF